MCIRETEDLGKVCLTEEASTNLSSDGHTVDASRNDEGSEADTYSNITEVAGGGEGNVHLQYPPSTLHDSFQNQNYIQTIQGSRSTFASSSSSAFRFSSACAAPGGG